MKKEQFTTFQAAKICGPKYQRLREWIDREQIVPSINKAKGVGTKTLFSKQDLYLIALFEMLMVNGFSRDSAKTMVEIVKRNLNVYNLLKDPSLTDHLIFIKHRVPAGVINAVIPISDEMFKTKSIFELLTFDGHFTDALEYDKFVMINFAKIRKQIDMRIG